MEKAGKHADHIIGRLSGVNSTDSKVEAAEKAIATAKLAGLPTRKMEKMLAAYKQQHGL